MLRLAGHLELPVIALVDTPGLDSRPGNDSAQTAAALAGVIGLTSLLPVPIVSVVIGEAAGAAGVALGIGDRILMQEHAVYTVGGAEGTDRRAAEPLAASRTLTAAECRRLGVVDTIIPEPEPGGPRRSGSRLPRAGCGDRNSAGRSGGCRTAASAR